ARFEQMTRDYKMSMDDFTKRGLGWVVSTCFVQFKRSLVLGDTAVVRTGITEVGSVSAKVGFEIFRKETNKLSADGYFEYTLVNLTTGRSEKLPQDIIERYSI
ncbi:MAG: acyl-CoA thioesterase, partial [Bacteroidota bacterium]